MKEQNEVALFFLMGAMLGLLGGTMIGHSTGKAMVQEEAIQRGFAEYNHTNGAWQWRKLDNYVEQEIKQETVPALPRHITRFVTNVIVDDHIIIDESGGMWVKQEMKK